LLIRTCFISIAFVRLTQMQNRRQKVFNRGLCGSAGGFAFVRGIWYYKINQTSTDL